MDACLEKCACRGSYLDKFLQPAILVVLQRGSSHGFQMISDLEKSGMVSGNGLDPAGLYRTLKRMETAGLVTSYWDTESGQQAETRLLHHGRGAALSFCMGENASRISEQH